MIKLIVRFGIIPFGLVAIFGAFITIGTILHELNNYDKYINNENYVKLKIKVDSLDYSSIDGNSASIYGYFVMNSKTIKIIFGNENENYLKNSRVHNTTIDSEQYYDDKLHYIWYRAGYEKAYPALPNETKFLVWQRMNKELWLSYIWLFSLIMTISLWKIGVKMGFMKKQNDEK